ncbi:hypothetical protein U9M48_008972 [Paspalum notatum var. saurae]|uniref:Uncharacterized protein n=1 Tax=Paspalum notatum var. saurae TaxID=547442 RepID=A0AAQ3SQD9_PASNO
MVCVGSKAMRPKGSRNYGSIDGCLDDSSQKKRGRKDKSEKPRKGGHSKSKGPSVGKPEHGNDKKQRRSKDGKKGKGRGKDNHSGSSIMVNPVNFKNQDALPSSSTSMPVQNILRKRVDPETAMQKTRRKELELATDAVISHTLQVLVEGCELEQLCTFLRNCIESFPVIAMDKNGSHVAEAALKSLATHLEDEISRVMIEEILNKICKKPEVVIQVFATVIAADAAKVMSSCYGSHVLRTLLCIYHTVLNGDCSEKKEEIVTLLEETSYSHFLEVIVEVAPEQLRNSMLVGTLRGSLFAISSHYCDNYVVQALISSAKTSDQMNQIWEELGPKMKELLELGKTGVVAFILAACQQLETYRLESSQALAAALSSDSESPDSIIVQISKVSGGSRVLESFLGSSATAKRKFKVFGKYSRRPDQWRANQNSKETTHRKFEVEFGAYSKSVGQTSGEKLSSEGPTKKRNQKEKPGKITEGASKAATPNLISLRKETATGEASQATTKHNQSGSSGPNAPPKKKKTWSKHLALLSRFQNKMKHRKPDGRAPGGFRQRSSIKRFSFSSRLMLEECGNMARVIRRTAVDCFAAAVAGGDEDEPPRYVQLDQVRYGVKREAFGPIYLVT